MSSHHIVRDEQEPALLLWQPGQLSYEQAGELLAWSPRVVATQHTLAEALAWGIKLDAVWAPQAQLEATRAAVAHQAPVAVCQFRENNSLQEVLHWLKAKDQQSVNLLADAEAQDFTLLQQLLALQQLVQVQVLSKGWRYSFFRPGSLQKWLAAKSHIRLIAFEGRQLINGMMPGQQLMAAPVQEIEVQQSGLLKITADAPFWLGEKI